VADSQLPPLLPPPGLGEPGGPTSLARQGSTVGLTSVSATIFSLSMGFSSSFYFKTFLILLVWLLLLVAGDVETNPGPRHRPDVRVLYSNIRGLFANLSELMVASAGFDILCLSETLVTSRRHLCELRIPDYAGPQQRLAGVDGSRGLAVYIKNGCLASRQLPYECACHEVIVLRVCGPTHNFYVFAFYRSPNADDSIFDCMLLAMARIQETDRKAAFVFVGDANAHHTDWLQSRSPTNSAGRAALDFCCLSGSRQLVCTATHVGGNCLDLVMTDVPDVINVFVGTPLGTSDHSYLELDVNVSQMLPTYDARRTVFVKSRVDWEKVRREVRVLPWSSIYRSADPVSVLNDSISHVIHRCVPTTVVGFRSGDAPWFNAECRFAFDTKQTAYRAWTRGRTHELWLEYQRVRVESQRVYDAARDAHYARSRVKLNDTSSSHSWWATLKSSLFGASSSLPALKGPGGRLVSKPSEKAELLSSYFDSKQSSDSFDVPASCFPETGCCSLAFRSSVVKEYLSDLDEHGGVDPVGVFPLFYKKVADILAPKLSRIFRGLLRSGSFPLCWRVANVTAIPKDGTSSDVSDYRPISITPILSKVYERLLSAKLSRYCESRGLFPSTQFSYRKGYGCVDALLSVSHVIQSALDAGSECRVVQLDFSAAFDRVNHTCLLYRLRCLGIGGPILGACHEFLSSRTQSVVVDGSVSAPVSVVSGVPQGSVLGPLLFILYTGEMFDIVQNRLVGYADDSTLIAVVPRPSDRPLVEASILRDLEAIHRWSGECNMKLNPGKTKSFIASRSRTALPCHMPLVFNGVEIKSRTVLKILGVEFDSKMTFETHIRSMVSMASRKIGLLRMARRMFNDVVVLRRCFFAFILPNLEYCSVVWSSAAACHLSLLDRVVRCISELCGGVVPLLQDVPDLVSLAHRREVAGLCMYYKIYNNHSHLLNGVTRVAPRRSRFTRAGDRAHLYEVELPRFRTVQYGRSFVPAFSRAWNLLPATVFGGGCLERFKRAANFWLSGV